MAASVPVHADDEAPAAPAPPAEPAPPRLYSMLKSMIETEHPTADQLALFRRLLDEHRDEIRADPSVLVHTREIECVFGNECGEDSDEEDGPLTYIERQQHFLIPGPASFTSHVVFKIGVDDPRFFQMMLEALGDRIIDYFGGDDEEKWYSTIGYFHEYRFPDNARTVETLDHLIEAAPLDRLGSGEFFLALFDGSTRNYAETWTGELMKRHLDRHGLVTFDMWDVRVREHNMEDPEDRAEAEAGVMPFNWGLEKQSMLRWALGTFKTEVLDWAFERFSAEEIREHLRQDYKGWFNKVRSNIHLWETERQALSDGREGTLMELYHPEIPAKYRSICARLRELYPEDIGAPHGPPPSVP